MNLVHFIEANAGTGKTTHLTEFILDRVQHGIPLDKICAVTFTEKSANEMVDRMRTKIGELIQKEKKDPRLMDQLNRSFIGTIHSFCTLVLRRYGDMVGIPPLFEVDADGHFFEDFFQSAWDRFITTTVKQARRPYDSLIATLGMERLEEIALQLCSRRFRFHRPVQQDLRPMITLLRDLNRWNVDGNKGWNRIAYKALEDFETNRPLLSMLTEIVISDSQWKNAMKDTLNCRDNEIYTAIESLQRDFVQSLLNEYRMLGYLRFDDLLLDVRDLLRDQLQIRKQLKEKYDLVLVDEMQDTDPVQYEVFLYICEQTGKERDFTLQQVVAGERKLHLQEGKLFVVGDPKQSIYGFRSADVLAYQRIKQVMQNEGAKIQPLTGNYRSCRNLVDFTNRLARRLFVSSPPEDSTAEKTEFCVDIPIADCVHLIQIEPENADAQHLRIIAEAAWLAEKVHSIVKNSRAKIKYKDIGILFRRLTNVHLYVDALCARNIRAVVEGEKFFFQSQEVIDFLNLLKCIVDEMDSIALAGLLRSPLFGLTDVELALFFKNYMKDFNAAVALDFALQERDTKDFGTLDAFLQTIAEIRKNLKMLTPGKLLDEVLTKLPVLTVATMAYGSARSDLAPLNILKIHKQALEADIDPSMSAYRFVKTIESYSKEAKELGQEAVADEGVDAVRIMSIHKSKGLDFPIVFLPLTDYGFANYRPPVELLYDWQSDTTGLRVKDFTESNYLHLKYFARFEEEDVEPDELLEKLEEEEKRVLYVAATRAKNQLYSCLVDRQPGSGDRNIGKPIFEFLKELHPEVKIVRERVDPDLFRNPQQLTLPIASLDAVLSDWQKIRSAWQRASLPQLTAITEEAKKDFEKEEFWAQSKRSGSKAVVVGLLCHGVLEKIDFRTPENFRDLLEIEKGKHFDKYTSSQIEAAASESLSILEKFLESEAARFLASAEILSRETPVFILNAAGVLSGSIDMVLRSAGKLWILDHKTHIDRAALPAFRTQMSLYGNAIDSPLATALVDLRKTKIEKL